mmetsp:Transcript_23965/g.42463  ORF Transcript_23965/g.42463 Transcript_23965/m.42463 type:complete len:343 (-) Transcript_23965:133-1161(-)
MGSISPDFKLTGDSPTSVETSFGKTNNDKVDGIGLEESLRCPLCLSLVCEPITVPCGHTFCRVCLYTAMKRSKKKCPYCRAVCHVDPASHSENIMIKTIVQKCFPSEYRQRLVEAKQEAEQLESTLPIFFYNNTLFPGSLLHLHLFEQRYRHMINRCVSSNRMFVYLPNITDYKANVDDVGLLAYVDECEFLPDGRALLKATIQKRIKVTNSWVEEGTQGLHYCQFSMYEEAERVEPNDPLLVQNHSKLSQFLSEVPSLRERVSHHIGKEPQISDPTAWSFWFAGFTTMISRSGSRQHALDMLRTTSTRERLANSGLILKDILRATRLNNNNNNNKSGPLNV